MNSTMIQLIKVTDDMFELTLGKNKLTGSKLDTLIRLEGYGINRYDIQEAFAGLEMNQVKRIDLDINNVFKSAGRYDN